MIVTLRLSGQSDGLRNRMGCVFKSPYAKFQDGDISQTCGYFRMLGTPRRLAYAVRATMKFQRICQTVLSCVHCGEIINNVRHFRMLLPECSPGNR